MIVDHGIRDYRVAKQKAAERLGVGARGSLPGNTEIEAAVAYFRRVCTYELEEGYDHERQKIMTFL